MIGNMIQNCLNSQLHTTLRIVGAKGRYGNISINISISMWSFHSCFRIFSSLDHFSGFQRREKNGQRVVRLSLDVQLWFSDQNGWGGPSIELVFGSVLCVILTGDSEIVGGVRPQVGDESFGHPSIDVDFLPVVFDLQTILRKLKLVGKTFR